MHVKSPSLLPSRLLLLLILRYAGIFLHPVRLFNESEVVHGGTKSKKGVQNRLPVGWRLQENPNRTRFEIQLRKVTTRLYSIEPMGRNAKRTPDSPHLLASLLLTRHSHKTQQISTAFYSLFRSSSLLSAAVVYTGFAQKVSEFADFPGKWGFCPKSQLTPIVNWLGWKSFQS